MASDAANAHASVSSRLELVFGSSANQKLSTPMVPEIVRRAADDLSDPNSLSAGSKCGHQREKFENRLLGPTILFCDLQFPRYPQYVTPRSALLGEDFHSSAFCRKRHVGMVFQHFSSHVTRYRRDRLVASP